MKKVSILLVLALLVCIWTLPAEAVKVKWTAFTRWVVMTRGYGIADTDKGLSFPYTGWGHSNWLAFNLEPSFSDKVTGKFSFATTRDGIMEDDWQKEKQFWVDSVLLTVKNPYDLNCKLEIGQSAPMNWIPFDFFPDSFLMSIRPGDDTFIGIKHIEVEVPVSGAKVNAIVGVRSENTKVNAGWAPADDPLAGADRYTDRDTVAALKINKAITDVGKLGLYYAAIDQDSFWWFTGGAWDSYVHGMYAKANWSAERVNTTAIGADLAGTLHDTTYKVAIVSKELKGDYQAWAAGALENVKTSFLETALELKRKVGPVDVHAAYWATNFKIDIPNYEKFNIVRWGANVSKSNLLRDGINGFLRYDSVEPNSKTDDNEYTVTTPGLEFNFGGPKVTVQYEMYKYATEAAALGAGAKPDKDYINILRLMCVMEI